MLSRFRVVACAGVARAVVCVALSGSALLLSATPGSAQAGGTQVYKNDFKSAVGSEWSNRATDTTPSGRKFLGQFGNSTTRLTLNKLPPHTSVTVSFDLYIIRTWDGSQAPPPAGPDIWDLSVAGGPTLLHTTFSNIFLPTHPYNRQSYPGSYPGGDFFAGTGAAEKNTLGYQISFPGYAGTMDTVYRLTFTFAHTASSIAFDFAGGTTEPVDNESWGLANVEVRVAPPVARVVVFRPSTREWFQRNGDGSTTVVQWGGPEDVPVPADYLGTGTNQIAVFRPSTRQWFIRGEDGSTTPIQWGGPNDIPVAGDHLGLGHAQIAVFRPATREWFIRNDDGSPTVIQFGGPGDVPPQIGPYGP
jgi:hypothetical protein